MRLGNGPGLSGAAIMYVTTSEGDTGRLNAYVECNIVSWSMDQATFLTNVTVEAPEYVESGYFYVYGADGREIIIQ